MHLNHTLTMLASYGEKTLAQLIVSTFSRKGKAVKIINFKEHNAHSSPLFYYSNIKILDKVKIENCIFINKYTNNKFSYIFTNCFFNCYLAAPRLTFGYSWANSFTSSMLITAFGQFWPKEHQISSMSYQTPFASKGNLQIPSASTSPYGKDAFIYIQKDMKGVMLNTVSLINLKSLFIEF